jgi:hypothetical protein
MAMSVLSISPAARIAHSETLYFFPIAAIETNSKNVQSGDL